jgi:predicted lipoprotein with Yx(FWY)xxD motif
MKRKITLLIAAAVAGGTFIAVFGLTTSASASRTSKGALVALGKTGLGRVLVDARGRTLYLFDGDTHRRSACYGACAVYWPPLLSSAKPRPGSGVRPSFLGLTKRTDGKQQVTYAGHPLYRYVGDKRAGQTTGEGLNDFGATWDAVAASGRAIESTAAGSTGTGGGYGSGR